MKPMIFTNALGQHHYLWTQSTEAPLAPATIVFLSRNASMPDTVQPLDQLPEDKVVIENPITYELKVYDQGDEPWQQPLKTNRKENK